MNLLNLITKKKCDKCYKFHVLRQGVTCKSCELSICRRCAKDLFNYAFEEKERDLGIQSIANTDKEVIAQLLKRIKDLEWQVVKLTLGHQKLKEKGKEL